MANKTKRYDESQIIKMFALTRFAGNHEHPLMQEWTDVSTTLNAGEQYIFDLINKDLIKKIGGWNEEMLKMNFIAFVLQLGHLVETDNYKTYYESTLQAEVNGYFLKVRADMMIAKGILERPETPYFYFQEYKKVKDPKGDVTAQLLEAFLIAQHQNNDDKPLYGCTVLGREWEFYVFEHKKYCVSQAYNATNPLDLMQIIAILRKFKFILETRLLS
jgi:hypothetical protein